MTEPTIPTAALEAIQAVHRRMESDGVVLKPETAWNLAYRYILDLRDGLPHIVESNDLKRARWRKAAEAVQGWMLEPGRLAAERMEVGEGNSRLATVQQLARAGTGQNLTGFAFEHVLAYLVHELNNIWPPVRRSIRRVRGYEIVSKSEVDELDMIVISEDDFRLFVSCLWTSRGDRVTADIYDAGFVRRRRPDVQTAVVTNEFKNHILDDLINAPEIDAVYHVCKEALLIAHRPTRDSVSVDEVVAGASAAQFRNYIRLTSEIKDLSELFADIDSIVQGPETRRGG